jgi:cytochrome c oxidase assembly protein subunit 15
MTNRGLILIAKWALVCVYLVVIAGSVVRMSGAGMGCPDWPKCFGYYIPPTEIETLTYSEGKVFQAGQMVVKNDTLWVATKTVDVNAEGAFQNHGDHPSWIKYKKHNYAKFNATHTWTEYINRLLTGLLIMPVLLLVILGFNQSRKLGKWQLFLWSFGALALMLYEAWLGKLVVDGHLDNGRITLHMLGTVGIVFCLLQALLVLQPRTTPFKYRKRLVWFSMLIMVVQIVLGTQVREGVDDVIRLGLDRPQWISGLLDSNSDVVFYIHRSFSWVITVAIGYLAMLAWHQGQKGWAYALAIPVVGEMILGFLFNYADYPALAQPAHLLLALALLGQLIYLTLLRRG